MTSHRIRPPLFEHCAPSHRAMPCIDRGRTGCPLIGGGDWNDGMNRSRGRRQRPRSVWLGFGCWCAPSRSLRRTLADARIAARACTLAAHARRSAEARRWSTTAGMAAGIARATFDDGTWLGS
ncbi:hypothetical protein ACU4GD_37680 [Cupriavidus basilensis]